MPPKQSRKRRTSNASQSQQSQQQGPSSKKQNTGKGKDKDDEEMEDGGETTTTTMVEYSDDEDDGSGVRLAQMLAEMAKSSKAYKRNTRLKLEQSYIKAEAAVVATQDDLLASLEAQSSSVQKGTLTNLKQLLERRQKVLNRLGELTVTLEGRYEEQRGMLVALTEHAGEVEKGGEVV